MNPEEKNFKGSEINDLYRRVINRHKALEKLLELKAPEVILRHEQQRFQEAVDAFFNDPTRGPVPATFGRLETMDSMSIPSAGESSIIELCIGDLTMLTAGDGIDVLVVSAFPGIYVPVPGTLIGALQRKGVSVAELAARKEVDLRRVFSCWMSAEVLNPEADIHFRRILCYEPYCLGDPAEQVGDIFRSLAPFVGGSPSVRTVAMPLVAAGLQRASADQMLQVIVGAAAHWITAGLPLTRLKIACLPGSNVDRLRELFSELKAVYARPAAAAPPTFKYHLFLSYAHADSAEAAWLEERLIEHKPDLRLFVDRQNLHVGSDWQREIFESLDQCEKVLAVLSPAYLASKVCLEEFNIALCRHREATHPILAPLYLYSAALPTYMKLIQYWDCREFNQDAIILAVRELAGAFES